MIHYKAILATVIIWLSFYLCLNQSEVSEDWRIRLLQYDRHEHESLARIVYAEAWGESFDGLRAVAEVVLNRSLHSGHTVQTVISKPGAFHGYDAAMYNIDTIPDIVHAACSTALYGPRLLPLDVIYFYNPKTASNSAWVSRIRKYAYVRIGNHIFCREEKYMERV